MGNRCHRDIQWMFQPRVPGENWAKEEDETLPGVGGCRLGEAGLLRVGAEHSQQGPFSWDGGQENLRVCPAGLVRLLSLSTSALAQKLSSWGRLNLGPRFCFWKWSLPCQGSQRVPMCLSLPDPGIGTSFPALSGALGVETEQIICKERGPCGPGKKHRQRMVLKVPGVWHGERAGSPSCHYSLPRPQPIMRSCYHSILTGPWARGCPGYGAVVELTWQGSEDVSTSWNKTSGQRGCWPDLGLLKERAREPRETAWSCPPAGGNNTHTRGPSIWARAGINSTCSRQAWGYLCPRSCHVLMMAGCGGR